MKDLLLRALAKWTATKTPRRQLLLAGDPRHFRAQRSFIRRLMGCNFPRKCPTCRQFTRQWRLKSQPGAWRCGSCGHAYLNGRIIVHRLEVEEARQFETVRDLAGAAGVRVRPFEPSAAANEAKRRANAQIRRRR